LVTAANGGQGKVITAVLLDKGYEVLALIRDENADLSSGVTAMYGDLADRATLVDSFHLVDSAVITLPLVVDNMVVRQWVENLTYAIQKSNIKKTIFNASGPLPDKPTSVAVIDIKIEAARKLMSTSIPIVVEC